MDFDNYLNNFYATKIACNPTEVWPIQEEEEYDPFTYSDEAKTILTGVQEGVVLEGEVVIPKRVTCIKNQAFVRRSLLTSITIPNSVTSIGSSAFDGCTGLTSITIPNSVTSIGDYAFKGCTGLTSITIGEEITTMGRNVFNKCSGLKSITWNAKKCRKWEQFDYAPFFGIYTNITSFTFGDKVESIPDFLCYSMSKLTSITIPNGVTSIGQQAFCSCTGLTSLTIPNSVKSIGYETFASCKGLTSIIIPESVTSIVTDAFYGIHITSANFINNSSATGYPWGATITE